MLLQSPTNPDKTLVIEQTLFISDLHLGPSSPRLNEIFLRFLSQKAVHASKLYILGDLFDAWVGDDDNTRFARKIRAALLKLSQSGTRIYFQPGNRDFLVGDRFCRETGIELLDDYSVIDLYGTPTLITHGDLLCTDDEAYQAFRKRSRSLEWQQNVLSKPLFLRLMMVRWYRFRSFLHKRKAKLDIMDVNHKFVSQTFIRFGVTQMIHGHTHRPAIHNIKLPLPPNNDEQQRQSNIAKRIVLPAWSREKSTVLCWDEGGFWQELLS